MTSHVKDDFKMKVLICMYWQKLRKCPLSLVFFFLKGDMLTDLTCSVCSEGHINWVKVYGGCVVLDGFFKIFRLVGCISLFLCL